jgi:hypothetical protein
MQAFYKPVANTTHGKLWIFYICSNIMYKLKWIVPYTSTINKTAPEQLMLYQTLFIIINGMQSCIPVLYVLFNN